MEKYRVPTKRKSELYRLYNFDNTIIGKVDSYTKLLNLRIGWKHKVYSFNLV